MKGRSARRPSLLTAQRRAKQPSRDRQGAVRHEPARHSRAVGLGSSSKASPGRKAREERPLMTKTSGRGVQAVKRHLNTGPGCNPGNASEAQTTNARGGRPQTPTTGLRVFVALSAALLNVIGDRVEVSEGLRHDLNAKSHAWPVVGLPPLREEFLRPWPRAVRDAPAWCSRSCRAVCHCHVAHRRTRGGICLAAGHMPV